MKTIQILAFLWWLRESSAFQSHLSKNYARTNTELSRNRRNSSLLHAQSSKKDTRHKSTKPSSRFGVRKRVRSVLEKAKTRTGIQNNSDYLDDNDDSDEADYLVSSLNTSMETRKEMNGKSDASSPPNTPTASNIKTTLSVSSVVADAASIGGLGSVDVEVAIDIETNNGKTSSIKDRSVTFTNGNLLFDNISEKDVISSDTAGPIDLPLPFKLPVLSPEQKKMLSSGERVQFQSDMGREGYGFVVVDVHAPAAVVWECLLDFYSYPQIISTVRDVEMFTSTHLKQDYKSEELLEKYEDGTFATLKHGVPSVTRAAFTLSKFRLKIAAIHKYRPHPAGDYMIFTLDPACTNMVLKYAKGTWHTQSNPDGKGDDYTRVWLLCELKVSPLLPQWITDYAARRAMPRATTWIKPHVEAAAELWFKDVKA